MIKARPELKLAYRHLLHLVSVMLMQVYCYCGSACTYRVNGVMLWLEVRSLQAYFRLFH